MMAVDPSQGPDALVLELAPAEGDEDAQPVEAPREERGPGPRSALDEEDVPPASVVVEASVRHP